MALADHIIDKLSEDSPDPLVSEAVDVSRPNTVALSTQGCEAMIDGATRRLDG